MKDVSAKSPTLRTAVAESFITMPEAVQALLREGGLEKGDALEIARAAGVLAACQEMNIDVPGQVSIVGFDDNILCQMLRPQLTTIHQPMREMGRAALQMLVDTFAGKPVRDAVVTPSLVIRRAFSPSPEQSVRPSSAPEVPKTQKWLVRFRRREL